MLAAGESQRHSSILNVEFPSGSRNQWRQKHHERAEDGSIAHLTRKAPTSKTGESPRECHRVMPSMFAWRLQCVQGLQKETFLHLIRLLGKREWSTSTSSRRPKIQFWSHSQFAVADLKCQWTSDLIVSAWTVLWKMQELLPHCKAVFCAGRPHLHVCFHA